MRLKIFLLARQDLLPNGLQGQAIDARTTQKLASAIVMASPSSMGKPLVHPSGCPWFVSVLPSSKVNVAAKSFKGFSHTHTGHGSDGQDTAATMMRVVGFNLIGK